MKQFEIFIAYIGWDQTVNAAVITDAQLRKAVEILAG